MATATEVLTLAQWFSPAFPVGAFAYSHGLEAAIERGQVQGGADLARWIEDVLRFGAGWNDCLLMAQAYRAPDAAALAGIDAQCRALQPAQERQMESDLLGAAFCKTTAALLDDALAGLSYPVAVGRAAQLAALPLGLTAQSYLHAMASNLVSVALRLVILGQTEGQRVIADLTPVCIDIADHATTAAPDRLSATAFLSDIAAMQHETQYSRIFRT